MSFALDRAYPHGVVRLILSAAALAVICAAPPCVAQSMVGYGLGVGAAGSSGGSLKKSGQAVADRLSTAPSKSRRTSFVGPPIPNRDRRTEHELPIDFDHASGVVRLYEEWSGPEDSQELHAAGVQAAEASSAPPIASSSAVVSWGRDWLGSTPEELRAEFGKPVLSVAGNGGPDDRQITHRLPDGSKARFLVRSGLVVRANRY